MREAVLVALEGIAIVLWCCFLAVALIAAAIVVGTLVILASAWAVELTAGWWP